MRNSGNFDLADPPEGDVRLQLPFVYRLCLLVSLAVKICNEVLL